MAVSGLAAPAVAQEASDEVGIQDIIVTAQKREQSLQDVPIAVSAISGDALEANRVTSIIDLATSTPNLSIREVSGGTQTPLIALRGVVVLGGQAGQDRSISQYLDGIYIASLFGNSFELPDLDRVEVLRGPQGTLFGRNATGGALSFITRDPSGEFSAKQQFSVGNRNQLRSSTRVELPQWGPFSASISYTHNERRGDVRNLDAGLKWDRTAGTNGKYGISTSPKWLGSSNSETVFAAVKFEPSDVFKTVYKFDWTETDYTPGAVASVLLTPERNGAVGLNVLAPALAAAGRVATGIHRPDAIHAGFTIPGKQRVHGHNLTSYLTISDDLSLKNTFGYRKSYLFVATQLDGLGGLTVTPGGAAALNDPTLVGAPLLSNGSTNESKARQWSDELQLNYESEYVTLTAGALYFKVTATTGAPPGIGQQFIIKALPNGVIPAAGKNYTIATTASTAAYAQAEVHVLPELDVVGGYRVTRDKKNGVGYVSDKPFPFHYDDTRSSYLLGANFRPADDILVYAKYSTAFVAGGALADITFLPESVKSWEAGLKTDLFDRHVRLNLALFSAKYKNLQGVVSGIRLTPRRDDISVAITREGDLNTKGFELEATVLPVRGLTLTSGVGYTDTRLFNVNPALGRLPRATYLPNWTVNLAAQYESEPVFADATVMFRVDALYRSKVATLRRAAPPVYDVIDVLKPAWMLNSRLALRGIDMGPTKVDVALWVKNLFDYDRPAFANDVTYGATAAFERARSFGADLIFDF